MTIAIDNIAAPARTSSSRGAPKAPLTLAIESLEVGQSFFLPLAETKEGYLRIRASTLGKLLSRKFPVRSTTEDGVKGLRFYRTE